MPPDASYGYGRPGQQPGYPQQQSYPPISQPTMTYGDPVMGATGQSPPAAGYYASTPSYAAYDAQYPAMATPPQVPTPYGPPPGRPEPLYGALPPGFTADVPHDPYAWQSNPVQPQAAMAPAAYPQQPAYYPQYDQNQAYAQSPMDYQPQPLRSGRPAIPRRLVAAGAGIAAVLVLIIGITVAVNAGGGNRTSSSINLIGATTGNTSTDQLLQAALGNALQTKSYSQKVSDKSHTVQRNVDVSATKTPKISGNGVVNDTGTEFDAYAGLNDTYVRLKKASILASKPAQAGKWVQVRKDGVSLDTSGTGGTSLDLLFTPTTALYNGLIIGNYSVADRAALLSIIKDQLVYRYDPTAVTQANVNGQAVSQYKITVSASGQQALSAKAAQLAGVDQQRISQAATIARLSGSANDHLIISIATKTQSIVQIIEEGSNDPTTIDYGNFDNIQVGQAPKPEAGWDDYVRQITGR